MFTAAVLKTMEYPMDATCLTTLQWEKNSGITEKYMSYG